MSAQNVTNSPAQSSTTAARSVHKRERRIIKAPVRAGLQALTISG